jgi:transposase
MHATTVGVDLAKTRFEVAVSDEHFRVVRRERLTRSRFTQYFANYPACLIVMEACGSAHFWGRKLQAQGHQVRLLPAQYVKAYVRRNKTDAADAAALIEASRCADIRPVPVKSVDQQVLQQLHRIRQQSQQTRTARINLLRGCLREFGIAVPVGIERGQAAVRLALQDPDSGLPQALRSEVAQVLAEIAVLKQRIQQIERTLRELCAADPIVCELMQIPGVGLLIATALKAAVGDIQRFPSGRHLSCWLGITAREHSSGEQRRLGGISKQGDVYLRTLLVHGARSALIAAQRAHKAGRPLDRLRNWAVQTQARCGTNKATVAFANKLARIIWATWHYRRPFNGNWSSQPSPVAPSSAS